MTNMDNTDKLEFACKLARECGKITQKYFTDGFTIQYKGDGSPVTDADIACEKHMRAAIKEAYPDHGIIGEEDGSTNSDADYVWVIDPIDGTKSFINRVPLYAILIGLLYKGEPVAGIAYFPATNELLTAVDGGGTLWNNTPVQIHKKVNTLLDAWVMTSDWAVLAKRHQKFLSYILSQAKIARTWGDAYAYNLLVTGRCHLAFDMYMHIWDIVALIPILKGSGAILTNERGDPVLSKGIHIKENYPCIASANAMLHTQVLAGM